ncbi:MAG: dCTP deaminase [Planctomycetaceae bacterium]|nr:dCTP deaminase [Planctomycetaceae bacterium]
MILSNRELIKALDEQRLIITPRPQVILNDPSQSPFGTHSVDLRLNAEILVPRGGTFVYDPTQPGRQADFQGVNSDRLTISLSQPYRLERNTFILASTLERVGLPLPSTGKSCLAARIEGKSSRARIGLLVHFTAPTVHPGWNGHLTLEVINLGPAAILLSPGMPIAQLIVEEVRGIPFESPSQFQNQLTPEGN